MEKLRSATIIPLDYTITGEPTRKEHSIVFFSRDWDELADLLSVPVAFMTEMQQRWTQLFPCHPERPPIDWEFTCPINVTLKYGYSNLPATLAVAHVLGKVPKKLKGQELTELTKIAQDLPVKFYDLPGLLLLLQLIDEIAEELADGFFYAEFAPRTSALTIKYYPPMGCFQDISQTICDAEGDPEPKRMNKAFTQATLGLLGDTKAVGTVHFDIGTSQSDRGKFIVDHIENSVRTCQILNRGVQDEDGTWDRSLNLARLKLVPERGTIEIRSCHRAPRLKKFNIVDDGSPTINGLGDGKKMSPVQLLAVGPLVMPTVYAEGLETPADMNVCGQGVVMESDGTYVLGDLVLKDYTPPTTNPPGG